MKFRSTTMGDIDQGRPQERQAFVVPDGSSEGSSDEELAQELQRQQSQQPRYVKTNMEELSKKRAEAIENSNKISRGGRSRVEYLLGIGRIKATDEIDGVKFELQSLKEKEVAQVWDNVVAFKEETNLKFQFELRIETLARALLSIDGMHIDMVLALDKNDEDYVDNKIAFLREMDENVVDRLYSFYQRNIVDVGKKKYAIKTEEDVKEVLDAVKKS